jgi:hypothetical protein
MKYDEYRLVFQFPGHQRIHSRPFDWCDFDILEESNELTREEIEAVVKKDGWFGGFWGRQAVAVIRAAQQNNQRMRNQVNSWVKETQEKHRGVNNGR